MLYAKRNTDPAAFSGIISLWRRVFGDSEDYIRAFYRSFDTRGNVFCAVRQTDGFRITSDLYSVRGDIVGLVNRVPVKLRRGDRIINGYYIYAGCVDSDYRGRGIYRDLMRAAERDTVFTVLIPAEDTLFELYRKMGYTETDGTPFPFVAERSPDLPRIVPFDGDTAFLYKLYRRTRGDMFIKDEAFFSLTVADFAKTGNIYYITDFSGKRCGYIIFSLNKSNIKIYDIYGPPYNYFDIMESDMHTAEKIKYKSMIRGLKKAPALNMFGEY